jgi:hypothetical protein
MTPKNIAIACVAVVILGFASWRLADYFQLFGLGQPKPSTDPAVVDPTSIYNPEEKKQLEQIQEQQRIEEQKPNRPPPSGS